MRTNYKIWIVYCVFTLILVFHFHAVIPLSLSDQEKTTTNLELTQENAEDEATEQRILLTKVDSTSHQSIDRMDVIETSQDHSISLDRFRIDHPADGSLRWVAYFLHETIAVVLQPDPQTLIDCSLIEVRQEKLQRTALRSLGTIMELVPIPVEKMVPLITLCGTLHPLKVHRSNLPDPEQDITAHFEPQKSPSPSIGFGTLVLPGTLWCGMKDRADRYERLGEEVEVDRCCRAHDHCPIKISMFERNYGASNYALGTRSHCMCEIEFYDCLKHVRTKTAKMVGDFYFNVLNPECLADDHYEEETLSVTYPSNNLGRKNLNRGKSIENGNFLPYHCIQYDRDHRCRMWRKRRDISTKMKKVSFQLKF